MSMAGKVEVEVDSVKAKSKSGNEVEEILTTAKRKTLGLIFTVPPHLVESCLKELDFREKGVSCFCCCYCYCYCYCDCYCYCYCMSGGSLDFSFTSLLFCFVCHLCLVFKIFPQFFFFVLGFCSCSLFVSTPTLSVVSPSPGLSPNWTWSEVEGIGNK